MKKDPRQSSRFEKPPIDNQARILFADDDRMVRQCIFEYLTRAGYAVTAVEDGNQAWEKIQSIPYDLLITDQQMPGMTGAELILKARLGGMTLPVIVAASDLEFYTDSCQRYLHVNALLQKPFVLVLQKYSQNLAYKHPLVNQTLSYHTNHQLLVHHFAFSTSQLSEL